MSNTLQQISLGKQGFVTSEQGIGMMEIGIIMMRGIDLYGKPSGTVDVTALMQRCVDNGVTLFDTAKMYQNLWGYMFGSSFCLAESSERRMRDGLAATAGKSQVATKIHPPCDKARVKKACYQSCKDLGVECIDLYYLHRIDPHYPIELSMEAMNELKAEGKIKYVGLCEASASTIRRAHAVCALTCVQMEWSLYARDIEDEILPLCAELGIGIVAYSPIARGLLADSSIDTAKLSGMDYRKMAKVGYVSKDGERELARALETLARSKGVSLANLSLAWLHKKGRDMLKGAGVVPIPGTGNPAHMEENVRAVALSYALTDADMQAIETCVPKEAMRGLDRYGAPPYRKFLFDVENNIPLSDFTEREGNGAAVAPK